MPVYVMVWPSSAQGNRPYAPPTRQTVCKPVTPILRKPVFCSFCFQSLPDSLVRVHLTTPLQSVHSALFGQNTGGGYTACTLPPVFKHLRTPQDSARSGVSRLPAGIYFLQMFSRLATRLSRAKSRGLCPPLSPHWSPVLVSLHRRCFPTGNALHPFSLHIVAGIFPLNGGGVPPPP